MKIAIIGTGIAGLGAAYMLHKDHEIDIYERNERIGGHSNTVLLGDGRHVDSGFITFNHQAYPNLSALFEKLKIKTQKSNMSFGVSLNNARFEYSSLNMFAPGLNLLNPLYYLMLLDITRFHREAPNLLKTSNSQQTLGEYLTQNKYTKVFIERYLLPLGSSIWFTSHAEIMRFPAKAFIRFFKSHGLLQTQNQPQWHSVEGGAKTYIDALAAPFKDNIKTCCTVKTIKRYEDYVAVIDDKDQTDVYDHVIIATHSDHALALLDNPSEDEQDILSGIPYTHNTIYVHRDPDLMPKRKNAWSACNVIHKSVTYWMNALQPHLGEGNVFITLNPTTKPAEDLTDTVLTYHHPAYTNRANDTWNGLKDIQGRGNIWYCGAWCGYGCHEDGLSAGISVARQITGCKHPWDIEEEISPAAQICMKAESDDKR